MFSVTYQSYGHFSGPQYGRFAPVVGQRTPLGYYALMIHIKLLAYLFHITNVMLLFVVLNIVDNGCISWSRLLL